MGRVATVSAICQICGDKSYGRHYGLYACDGCACFWKRTIRRNISYQCISGANDCPVDRQRRNWCPACRLRKCEQLQMNKNAVQKERGPRSERLTTLVHRQLVKNTPCQESLINMFKPTLTSDYFKCKLELLLHTMQKTMDSTIISFLSVEQKKEILEKYWPKLVILHQPCFQPDLKFESETVNKILKKCRDLSKHPIDVEEIRLLCCIFFCRIADQIEHISFATTLCESYEFWLARHCIIYYPLDERRYQHLLFFLSTIINFADSDEFVKEYFVCFTN